MADFVTDGFAGTLGTLLSTYSANWSKQTGWTENAYIGNDAQTFYVGNSAAACWVNSATPASADYEVSVDLTWKGGPNNATEGGVCARAQSGVDTMYYLYYQQGISSLGMAKRVSGAATSLGSAYTMTLTQDVAKNILLRCEGNQISAYVDGVLRIGPVTDSSISGAGKAGVMGYQMREVGVKDALWVDNFKGTDLAAAASGGRNRMLMGVG